MVWKRYVVALLLWIFHLKKDQRARLQDIHGFFKPTGGFPEFLGRKAKLSQDARSYGYASEKPGAGFEK